MGLKQCWMLGVMTMGATACSADFESTQPDHAAEADTEQLGEVRDALRRSTLTRSQASTVLFLIDRVCGDTWCSGDYNYGFDYLACWDTPTGEGVCKLWLRLIPREGMPSAGRHYFRSCTTRGFRDFESLVHTTRYGYQSLEPEYYDALTECTTELEARLRQHLFAKPAP
jgi:hypothetical protein